MTPEAKVKKKVTVHLKTLGAYYFYPVTGGYGKSGVPDIIGCYEGKFFGVEIQVSPPLKITQVRKLLYANKSTHY